jgi:hypothetical protein
MVYQLTRVPHNVIATTNPLSYHPKLILLSRQPLPSFPPNQVCSLTQSQHQEPAPSNQQLSPAFATQNLLINRPSYAPIILQTA